MFHLFYHGVVGALPLWQYILITLILVQITIVSVTVYYHRACAHRALKLHPYVEHFFRFWLWFTTGMIQKVWVAVHRKHHKYVDQVGDPHSPKIFGITRVFFLGVHLYRVAGSDPRVLREFGKGTSKDWVEKNVYMKHPALGLILLLVMNIFVFGVFAGIFIFVTQALWIPIWAAGVVNGFGHYIGYRNHDTADTSRNLWPFGIWIGGEELHNNHHNDQGSAKLSHRWFEFDLGWGVIWILEKLGLAHEVRTHHR